jgi:hypothetical protein
MRRPVYSLATVSDNAPDKRQFGCHFDMQARFSHATKAKEGDGAVCVAG